MFESRGKLGKRIKYRNRQKKIPYILVTGYTEIIALHGSWRLERCIMHATWDLKPVLVRLTGCLPQPLHTYFLESIA
jgi:hypothetical protein